MKLKELRKRMKGWKNKSWLATQDGVELFFSLIDVKVMSRVLRMARITKEQLFWCEEKMKKLDLSEGRLQREPWMLSCFVSVDGYSTSNILVQETMAIYYALFWRISVLFW